MLSRPGRGTSMLLVLAVALTSVLTLVAPGQATAARASLTVSRGVAIGAEQVRFAGVVPSAGHVRRVLLQRHVGRRWVGVTSSRTTSHGSFAMVSRVPRKLGRYSYRIFAPQASVAKLKAVGTTSRVVRVVRQTATVSMPKTGSMTRPFTVTARFSPVRLGRRVQVQELVSRTWRAVGSGTENRSGVARVSAQPMSGLAGRRSFRALALARSGAGAIATPTRTVSLSGNPAGLPKLSAVDTTPRVVDDSVVTEAGVRELRQVGTTMYAGGDFHSVLNAARTATYTRTNLFSFDANSGAVQSWAPAVNGPVYAMESSADGRYLYIGGDFTSFEGVSVHRLVRYDLQLHAVDTSFVSPLTSAARVSDLQLVNGRLFVAGVFPGGIVALDPSTGAQTSYFDPVQVTGSETGYSTRVYRFAVNPAATRMVVIGSFTAVGGAARQQAAMIQLGASTTSVSAWSSTRWNEDCVSSALWYTRAVGWAPNGSYFAIGTTGAGSPRTVKLCDTVTRWNPVDAGNQQPVWIQYSGGDTFHSLTVTNAAVYVGGHFRWLDNPLGRDFKGAGAVDRLGLGALDPATGRAFLWNPTKSVEGGLGAFDLYFTGRGLWVAHFEHTLAKKLHEGLGLLPF